MSRTQFKPHYQVDSWSGHILKAAAAGQGPSLSSGLMLATCHTLSLSTTLAQAPVLLANSFWAQAYTTALPCLHSSTQAHACRKRLPCTGQSQGRTRSSTAVQAVAYRPLLTSTCLLSLQATAGREDGAFKCLQ